MIKGALCVLYMEAATDGSTQRDATETCMIAYGDGEWHPRTRRAMGKEANRDKVMHRSDRLLQPQRHASDIAAQRRAAPLASRLPTGLPYRPAGLCARNASPRPSTQETSEAFACPLQGCGGVHRLSQKGQARARGMILPLLDLQHPALLLVTEHGM